MADERRYTIYEVFDYLTCQNEEFIAELARHALQSSLEIEADTWNDRPLSERGVEALPTLQRGKEQTKHFMDDMLGDFKRKFYEEVDSIRGTASLSLSVILREE